ADQAIDGAARYAEILLATVESPGLFPDPTSYESEAVAVGEASFWFLGRPTNATNTGTVRTYGLVDEASKINLNSTNPQLATMLSLLPGMTEDLAAAIITYRDAKTPKNFESIEELALVEGMTRL